jgi:hypothetical protein
MPAIIALVLFFVALYLYVLFIHWMFVGLGPTFIYVTSFLLSWTGPFLYVRALLATFAAPGGRSTPRNWLFAFVGLLVASIHLDFLVLAFYYAQSLLDAAIARELYPSLAWLVAEAPINGSVFVLGLQVLPAGMPGFSYLLFASAGKGALIVPAVLAIRGLSSPIDSTREPARLSYFQYQALLDVRDVVRDVGMNVSALTVLAVRRIATASVGVHAFGTWPLTIMAYVALVPPIVLTVTSSLFLLTLHGLALGAAWLAAMALSGLLRAIEQAVIRSRAGYARCPHANCHHHVPLPVFLCPACGVPHNQLLPGACGVLNRVCKCGRARLPTLFWLGKGKLESRCPKCTKPMREELFGENIHVPIYGGPSAGKTMFMMAATWQLVEGTVPGVAAAFIEPASERAYQRQWKPDFEAGYVRQKTTNLFPDAFLMSVSRGGGLPSSLYLYDPAGEALDSASSLEGHTFLNDIDGLALLIDPLSLPSFARAYRQRGGPDLRATTSIADPEEVVARIVNTLEGMGGLVRGRGARTRLAAILTKADITGFGEELGLPPASTDPLGEDWARLGLDRSAVIREWLANNESHLLSVLETHFPQLRFFAVSALGHGQSGRAFVPSGVLEPLAWLLSVRRSLSHPVLGMAFGRMMELGSAAAVVLLFVVAPVLLAWWYLH